MLAHGIGTPESPIHCRHQGWGYRCARSLALDAKVIIYWYDHGSDLLTFEQHRGNREPLDSGKK